ncbi:MAG: DNA repair protein RadA [Candidatus Sulfobium sp.]
MSKANKTFYLCQSCGYSSAKWLGKCPDCGNWNSFAEEKSFAGRREGDFRLPSSKTEPVALNVIHGSSEDRVPTGLGVGGDPGIGKSTLLLQAFSGLARKSGRLLYVSGEESAQQIKMRADRLSVNSEAIYLLAETSLEGILEAAGGLTPGAMVVDSVQTVFTPEILSAPGSVGQVRECAARLMMFAKHSGIPVFIVGHVTKEGAIAGPRVLEHIVDTVLYFEGDRGHTYRVLRTIKNRFGSTNEIGIFEMSDSGLREVDNPSELFLSERPGNVPGSTVVASIEGTRPLMIEMQALVSQSNFGMPRRTAIGVDLNRVNLLIAVLEKRAGMHLGGMDVFLNVVGGLKIPEPAVDLGIIGTLSSSFRDLPIPADTFVFGEVGLSGEIRGVAQAEARLREASKIGFRKAVIPAGNAQKIGNKQGLELVGVADVEECLEALLG